MPLDEPVDVQDVVAQGGRRLGCFLPRRPELGAGAAYAVYATGGKALISAGFSADQAMGTVFGSAGLVGASAFSPAAGF